MYIYIYIYIFTYIDIFTKVNSPCKAGVSKSQYRACERFGNDPPRSALWRGAVRVYAEPLSCEGNKVKCFRDFNPKAKARTWPRLSYMSHIRLTTAGGGCRVWGGGCTCRV